MQDAKDDFILVMFFTRNRGSCLSRWLRGVRPRYASALLLRLRLRIPLGAWLSVCCECYVLSGRCFCNGPIPCPEESSTGCGVSECDHEVLIMRRSRPKVGLLHLKKLDYASFTIKHITFYLYFSRVRKIIFFESPAPGFTASELSLLLRLEEWILKNVLRNTS
jgi:hypothetical protein